MNLAFRAILAATFCICPCVLPVASKTNPKLQQGLVEETAKFDMSLSKYTFQLGIQHNEFNRVKRKRILQAQLQLLRGGTQGFRLGAAEQGVRLQSQRAKNGTSLKGAVDKNGQPLTGRVLENPRSPLNTIERVHSPFQLDLRQLTSAVAPDIAFRMDEEISQARSRTAGKFAKQENAMDPNLRADTPHPDMPATPARTNVSADITRAFESEVAKSKQSVQQAARQASESLRLAMGGGDSAPAKMPMLTGDGSGDAPKTQAIGVPERSTNSTKLTQTEREMTAELARAQTKLPPSPSELDAKLADAKGRARTNVAAAEPGLDAVLTHVRPLAGTTFPSVPKSVSPGDTYDVVPWDEWHARFASLANDPILKNVSKTKKTTGFDTVQITVWRDHRLEAKLTKASSGDFDQAILQAYKSLTGNPGLAFPKNSHRQSITFLIDNEHKGVGAPSSVQSQTSVGDREVFRYHL
jgi:hypothetical protein